jgi:hypothetical protein
MSINKKLLLAIGCVAIVLLGVVLWLDLGYVAAFQGLTNSLMLDVAILLVGILFGLLCLVPLNRSVLSRLTKLGKNVTEISECNDTALRVSLPGKGRTIRSREQYQSHAGFSGKAAATKQKARGRIGRIRGQISRCNG